MHVKLAAALQRKGHRVGVITLAGSALRRACEEKGIACFPLNPRFKYLDLPAALAMKRIFEHNNVQICIIGLSKDVSTVVLATKLGSPVRLVYFQQMQFGHNKRDFFHRWSYASLERWVTLTNAMRVSVLRNTMIPDEKIRVIPFGADMSIFDPSRYKRTRSRKIFGISSRALAIALIGRFDPQKGHEDLLLAAPKVLEEFPHSIFLFVGEETRGEEGFRNHLQSLVESSSLQERVRFLPFTSNVPELLAAIDLVVMPSYSESFGFLAVEAMAMGIPVVGTNTGGLSEIIQDGVTGFLTQPGDYTQLADRIVKVLKEKKLYKAMSVNSLARARRHFDLEKNVSQLEAVLAEAL
ncbi:MAG: glycosyltransferase family 4 protein [Ignavibacteriales bacterium]|nr:glycosyltransferase family 4 protein [Ignavibacteriales bacterium]